MPAAAEGQQQAIMPGVDIHMAQSVLPRHRTAAALTIDKVQNLPHGFVVGVLCDGERLTGQQANLQPVTALCSKITEVQRSKPVLFPCHGFCFAGVNNIAVFVRQCKGTILRQILGATSANLGSPGR